MSKTRSKFGRGGRSTYEPKVTVSANLASVITNVCQPQNRTRLFKVCINMDRDEFYLASQLYLAENGWYEDYRRWIGRLGPSVEAGYLLVKIDDLLFEENPKWIMIFYNPEQQQDGSRSSVHSAFYNQTNLATLQSYFGDSLAFGGQVFQAESFGQLYQLDHWVAELEKPQLDELEKTEDQPRNEPDPQAFAPSPENQLFNLDHYDLPDFFYEPTNQNAEANIGANDLAEHFSMGSDQSYGDSISQLINEFSQENVQN